jgi:hypothetical protein
MAQLSTLGTASSENFVARANPLREREIPRNGGGARRRAVGIRDYLRGSVPASG